MAILFIVLAAVPLLWPRVPPLTDLPGHIGGYRILFEAGQEPLAEHYRVDWAPIGNLGVEGLVLLLAPLIGVEPAAKFVVILIPMLTVAAMLWLGREAQGERPVAAGFALPLAFALPFQFGFVNFTLGQALALAALALWLRLARRWRDWHRAALFVPIASVIWLCHSFGWAMLGLFAFGAEWALRRAAGGSWWRSGIQAAAMAAPMAIPIVLFARHWPAGGTGRWFDLELKLLWLVSVLRERWPAYDLLCAGILLFLLVAAWRSPRLRFAPVLGVPALLGAAVFLILPFFYAGGSMIDMRLLPASLALALLAIRVAPGQERLAGRLAIGGTAFFVARIATSTLAFVLFAQGQEAALRGIDVFPVGASVLVLVDEPPADAWDNPRLSHVAGLAIARRRVFTNEQWAIPGQQLISPLHPSAAGFDRDPSQLVYQPSLPGSTNLDDAIARFDRGTFGYVWTIGFPAGRAHAADLKLIWSNGTSAIYRVAAVRSGRSAPAADAAAGL